MKDKKYNQVSDQAILDATGKSSAEWFAFIDSRNGTSLTHKEIAAMLGEETELDAWWQQSVTVNYELARGMRKPHQTPDGFQISKSKTFPFSVDVLFNTFIKPEERENWLDDTNFLIRNSTPNKTIRITWVDEKSHVDVYFYPKKDKTMVTINHRKLDSSLEADKMKDYWGKQFTKLTAFLSQ